MLFLLSTGYQFRISSLHLLSFSCPASKAISHPLLRFCMGGLLSCPRRAPSELQDEWLLIGTPQPVRRLVWKKSIKAVIRLLALRKLWAKLGTSLAAIKHLRGHPVLSQRQINCLKTTWQHLGRWLQKKSSARLTDHLVRRHGSLTRK